MIDLFTSQIALSWVYAVLMIVYCLSIISTIVVILSENRSPVKSLAWVTVLVLLPLVGLILYIFFGRSLKNKRMISRRNRRRLRKKESFCKIRFDRLNLTAASIQLIKLARSLSGAIYYNANSVKIYSNGSEKFNDLMDDLRQAKNYINLQYYIIEDDQLGTAIKEILIEKAKAGIVVRLIYDHVGSFKTSNKYFKELKKAGVQAYPFFKVVFPPFGTRINWRNHRKIVVIDGKVGYIGGMNIAQRYIDGGKEFNSWRDTHLRITGPAVGALQYSFAVDWNFMGQSLIEEDIENNYSKTDPNEGDGMQLLTSGPTSQWSNISLLFIKAVGLARKRVYVQTPYFLPTEALLRALQTSALAGIDVRIMLPLHSDSKMLDAASHSYITECLQAGIKVYLYRGGMLHAKMVMVDDEFVSVGSTNLDFRSFEHNFESNLQIYSREVNQRMAQIFYDDLKSSERVGYDQWRKRPVVKKAVESIVRLLSPIL